MEGRENRFIAMPLAFTGMGIFRVWTETVYSNSMITFPTQHDTPFGFTAFNLMAAVILILLALNAKRVSPLYNKKWVYVVTAATMVASTCLNFLSYYIPECAAYVGLIAALSGAVGISFIILLWSELFGCLNPLRVGLYFSGGLIVGALILWLFKGLAVPWLWVCTCLIPPLSLYCLERAYKLLPAEERPRLGLLQQPVPWKPIAIVALYSFAYGMCESVFGSVLGIHSGLGCVFAAAVVYAAICYKRDNLQLALTYRAACILAIISLIPFGSFMPFGDSISSFCALASYTFVLIAIMVVLSNLTYQYGFNAVWLFGIERAVRLVSVEAGAGMHKLITLPDWPPVLDNVLISIIVAAMVVIATKFFLSEKQLTTPWGIVLKDIVGKEPEDSRARIGAKVNEISDEYGLTARESEILLLLALGKKPAQIERELYVAASTIKTHVKHIYQKLDVHSREEMFEMLGITENTGADSGPDPFAL